MDNGLHLVDRDAFSPTPSAPTRVLERVNIVRYTDPPRSSAYHDLRGLRKHVPIRLRTVLQGSRRRA